MRVAVIDIGTNSTRLLIAEYLLYRMCGRKVAERTNASTTQIMDARTSAWATDLIEAIGDDERRWPEIVPTGPELHPPPPPQTPHWNCSTVSPPSSEAAIANWRALKCCKQPANRKRRLPRGPGAHLSFPAPNVWRKPCICADASRSGAPALC